MDAHAKIKSALKRKNSSMGISFISNSGEVLELKVWYKPGDKRTLREMVNDLLDEEAEWWKKPDDCKEEKE